MSDNATPVDDGLTAAQLAELFRLPPADAMAWMHSRGRGILTHHWQDLWQEEHSRYFTVSRLARLDLLQSVYQSISASVAGDLTCRHWIGDTEQLLRSVGWWGEKEVLDPATGEKVKTAFTPARLHLIYDTNTRQAAAQDQWERILRTRASHPHVRYITLRDDQVRPAHAAWDNVTLPVDDPFWQTRLPPCGWRCRCRFVSVNQKDYDQGTTPTGAAMVKTAPPAAIRALTNRRTGQVMQMPAGVDPGFGTIPVQGQRLCELDARVREKLNSVIPAIAHAAQYEGLTLQSAAATYAEKAWLAQPGNDHMLTPLALSPPGDAALALPVSKKAPLGQKMLGLEHDGVRHVWLQHGLGSDKQAREEKRGQVPIEPGDLAAFPEIFNRANSRMGDHQEDRTGTPLVAGRAVFGGFRYEFVAKVGRFLIVPYTLYKWAI
jgi:SPP1 gp7 family putative phage head morphogenesis protein